MQQLMSYKMFLSSQLHKISTRIRPAHTARENVVSLDVASKHSRFRSFNQPFVMHPVIHLFLHAIMYPYYSIVKWSYRLKSVF